MRLPKDAAAPVETSHVQGKKFNAAEKARAFGENMTRLAKLLDEVDDALPNDKEGVALYKKIADRLKTINMANTDQANFEKISQRTNKILDAYLNSTAYPGQLNAMIAKIDTNPKGADIVKNKGVLGVFNNPTEAVANVFDISPEPAQKKSLPPKEPRPKEIAGK